ncbi:LysR substrate-binding domain-containing protein [Mangrovicoccus sp. HB161399]|uniref:LysR substrate-binding domain-containing protein n=1 Tax=Mangrovicoccus sp. HB161399 TaxID=2720392 RepID=UPI00155792AA|nr:LysR substrate-binding domain-containing protein [Mangrovicoccus sp. HB161399]
MSEIRPTHRQIEAFRAVMVAASVTEAARMLSVSQPAVSKILGQLEAALGFALFERRQGGLKPTDAAFALYTEVERSYSGLERVARAALRIRNRSAGRLRIAALPTFSLAFLGRVVIRMRAEHADVQLSMQNYNSEEVVDFVAAGLCDLGFAMTPVDRTRVEVGALMSVPSFCILPPGHRLSAQPRVSVRDLEGEEFIATSEGTSSRLRTDALFDSMNVTRRINVDARWSATISELVESGLGMSIVDAFAAWQFARRGGTVRPLAENLDFTFVCVQPRQAGRSGLAQIFLDIFGEELAAFRQSCNDTASWHRD